jgi:uncharacterized protein (DUF697 family)
MHDIDRTQLQYGSFQPEFEFGEMEWSGEMEGEGVLSEAQEMQLASELLEVTNEAELEQFLGDFIKKVGSVAGSVINSPIGQAVGGVLKGVAKKALPLAGGAIGGYFGGPLGAKIGSGLATAAGSALGLEAEQLEQEDREFEGARQFVRVAADTVKTAAGAPPGADPAAVAQSAAVAAASKFAPGLIGPGTMPGASPEHHRHHDHHGRSGRWVRHGKKIVLFGV